ncbi:MAG: hypothetical protein Aurels2KO_04930 [Aureliella sp.]
MENIVIRRIARATASLVVTSAILAQSASHAQQRGLRGGYDSRGSGGAGYGTAAGSGVVGEYGADGGYGGAGYGGPSTPPLRYDFARRLEGNIPEEGLEDNKPSKVYSISYRMGTFAPVRRTASIGAPASSGGGYGGMEGGGGYGGMEGGGGYGGMEGGGGYGGGMGEYGGAAGMSPAGYGGEDYGEDMGMGGMDMEVGMRMGMGSSPRRNQAKVMAAYAVVYSSKDAGLAHVLVIAADPDPAKKKQDSLYCVADNLTVFTKSENEKEELDIVVDMIKESIQKEELIDTIQTPGLSDEAVASREKRLREVLTAQYDTQLRRQEHEVRQIESRVATLRKELQRRKAARDRVVDVKLGRIVLEAQGLLNAAGSRR